MPKCHDKSAGLTNPKAFSDWGRGRDGGGKRATDRREGAL